MEIATGIHRIVCPLGERFNALYLLVGTSAALLVDTGLAGDPDGTLLPYLAASGIAPDQVRYVINTHADFDHTGGNRRVRDALPAALLMCGELDRPMVDDLERMIDRRYGEFAADHGLDDTDATKAWIRENAGASPIDVGLVGGERIRLSDDWTVEVIHTPGHSWGSVSVWDPRSRAMIIGDAVLWNAVLLATGEPAFPPTYRYLSTYLATIGRLQGMDIDLLLTSHFPVARGADVAVFLAESRAFTERVDAALEAELAVGPRTLAELTQTLGGSLGGWPEASSQYLCYPLLGHLERMVEFGRVEARRRGSLTEYAARGSAGAAA